MDGQPQQVAKEKRGDGEAQRRQDDTTMQSKKAGVRPAKGAEPDADADADADADENEPKDDPRG